MIYVRVHLTFSSPSGDRLERYSTLVAVIAEGYARGEHLEVALWRAAGLGFPRQPLAVRESFAFGEPQASPLRRSPKHAPRRLS